MNVLLILGHPRKDSLCAALFAAWRDGARAAGASVETLLLADLAFDPNVRVESPGRQPLEPDPEIARKLIEWADHLVFVHPTWWGCEPASLKGFLRSGIGRGWRRISGARNLCPCPRRDGSGEREPPSTVGKLYVFADAVIAQEYSCKTIY